MPRKEASANPGCPMVYHMAYVLKYQYIARKSNKKVVNNVMGR